MSAFVPSLKYLLTLGFRLSPFSLIISFESHLERLLNSLSVGCPVIGVGIPLRKLKLERIGQVHWCYRDSLMPRQRRGDCIVSKIPRQTPPQQRWQNVLLYDPPP